MKEKETEEKRKAVRKRLAEMNLLDDFLFGTMVSYPEVGEQFVKELLRIIFGREFKHLSITAQKVIYGADTDQHGARLDVCLEPEVEEGDGEDVTVYDIEPDQTEDDADRKALPRRMRFYHGKLAARSLESGLDYDRLKNVVIIMIVPYDPFGLDRMVYTIKNHCVEEPDMPYEDGAGTLFLYTKGTKGVEDEALGQLLRYMEETTYKNAVNEDLRKLHKMVVKVKKDPEVTVRYMIAYLREMERLNKATAKAMEDGMKAGMETGMKTGMEAGMKAGMEAGMKAGRTAGELYRLVALVCKKRKKQKSVEEIAEDLEEDISVIEPIYRAAEEFAPEYDPDPVFEQVNADNKTESE